MLIWATKITPLSTSTPHIRNVTFCWRVSEPTSQWIPCAPIPATQSLYAKLASRNNSWASSEILLSQSECGDFSDAVPFPHHALSWALPRLEGILRDILAREIQRGSHDDLARPGKDANLTYTGNIHSILRSFMAKQHGPNCNGEAA